MHIRLLLVFIITLLPSASIAQSGIDIVQSLLFGRSEKDFELPVERVNIHGLHLSMEQLSDNPMVAKAVRQVAIDLMNPEILNSSCPSYAGIEIRTTDLPVSIVPRGDPGSANHITGNVDGSRANLVRMTVKDEVDRMWLETEDANLPRILTKEEFAGMSWPAAGPGSEFRSALRGAIRRLGGVGLTLSEENRLVTPEGETISVRLRAGHLFAASRCHMTFLEELNLNFQRIGLSSRLINCQRASAYECLQYPVDIEFVDTSTNVSSGILDFDEDFLGVDADSVFKRIQEEDIDWLKSPSDLAGMVAAFGEVLIETGKILPFGVFTKADK